MVRGRARQRERELEGERERERERERSKAEEVKALGVFLPIEYLSNTGRERKRRGYCAHNMSTPSSQHSHHFCISSLSRILSHPSLFRLLFPACVCVCVSVCIPVCLCMCMWACVCMCVCVLQLSLRLGVPGGRQKHRCVPVN